MDINRTYIIIALIIALIFSACGRDRKGRMRHDLTKETELLVKEDKELRDDISSDSELLSQADFDMLAPAMPSYVQSQILERIGYVTSYNRKLLCPNWVSWELTHEHTDGPYSRKGVPYYDEDGRVLGIGLVTSETGRNGYFVDMDCEEPRQLLTDWSRDYNMSHGHICPAGDNKWDKAAMNQSFLLSNMCPQDASLNSGAWRKLEEKCRKWANKYGSIFIVAGPIYYNTPSRFSGHIAIPDAFFKVVLCLSGKPRAIGFVYENSSLSQSMNDTYCTVDHVEEITGFDFFSQMEDDIEDLIEAECNIRDW